MHINFTILRHCLFLACERNRWEYVEDGRALADEDICESCERNSLAAYGYLRAEFVGWEMSLRARGL